MSHRLTYGQTSAERTAKALQHHFELSNDSSISQEISTWLPMPTDEYLRILEVWHKMRWKRTEKTHDHSGVRVVRYTLWYQIKSWWENKVLAEIQHPLQHELIKAYPGLTDDSSDSSFVVTAALQLCSNRIEPHQVRLGHCPLCGASLVLGDDLRVTGMEQLVVSCSAVYSRPVCAVVGARPYGV
jgi:hypothetical protein